MFKRLVCLLCCALLAIFAPAGAMAATEARIAGFDGDNSRHRWEDNGFFTRMQARTGVQLTFDEYTDYTKWQEAKTAMFASGDLPDVLFKAELTENEQITWAQSGQLIDLAPLLAENAPNLSALLAENPTWKQAITLPDGKIVALPMLNRLPAENAMWINRKWLDTLKLTAPNNWEELVQVLRAFRDGDPNQNGKADEIPFSYLGPWDLKFLAHAFGLVANDYNVYTDETGAVRFMPEQSGYVQMLAALSDAFAEGLLDANGFYTSDTFRTVSDINAAATYGLYFGPNPLTLLPMETAQQYELLMPLTWEGKQVYRELNGSVIRGTFAITSACKDPAAMLRWVDVLYSQEGATEALAGEAGKDYYVGADGTWSYAGDTQTSSSYVLYDLSIYDSGNMPWLFPTDFYARYNNESITSVQAQLQKLRACIVNPFPVYTLTPEQSAEIAPVQAELGRYVDESLARFVTGEWDAHDAAAIDAYRNGLAQRGLDGFIRFWQDVADAAIR